MDQAKDNQIRGYDHVAGASVSTSNVRLDEGYGQPRRLGSRIS
jgi:hypothetical protein